MDVSLQILPGYEYVYSFVSSEADPVVTRPAHRVLVGQGGAGEEIEHSGHHLITDRSPCGAQSSAPY